MHIVADVQDLRAHYVTRAYGIQRTVKAVEGVSLQVRQGEIYGIVGESGCGKSTLLKVLMGEATPPLVVLGGSVRYSFGNQDYYPLSMTERELGRVRWQEVSYIPQGSMHLLNPVQRVRDTFRDFVSAHRPMRKAEIDDMVRGYVRHLGLPEQALSAFPHQLSGGMRQRVTIALATILSPKLVLADEPTTALDVVVQRGVLQLLKQIRESSGSTLVMATHDMGVQANLADRVAVLYAGKVVEEADTETVFRDPLHPYTQHLIRSLPKMGDKSQRISIPGNPPALDNPPPGCRFHPRCPVAREACKYEDPPLVEVAPGRRVACSLAVGRSAHGR